jgi:hypothetical protein
MFILNLNNESFYDEDNILKNSSNNLSDNLSEKSLIEFLPGIKIYHSTFGIGIIQKKYETSLGETLDILFENNSMKSIVTKYAKIKIIVSI